MEKNKTLEWGDYIGVQNLERDIIQAKRNYIEMFNALLTDEDVTSEKIDCINSMLSYILTF